MGRVVVPPLAVAMMLAAAVAADAAGLPEVTSGHGPGPDALYAPPPRAPQLENVAPWAAPPILISGASAYREGEFLYQDFLYDDHGGAGVKDSGDPFGADAFSFSPKAGTLTYPTDPVFANNAADLVELRVKPLRGATAFRITLNSLQDRERTAFTIALGDSGAPVAWPHGAGVRSPAELFLTVHGTTAELLEAATGAPRTPGPTAAVDLERRQIDVRVPAAAWDPGRGKVRMAAGAGLWDTAAGTYLAPRPSASATAPGGVSASGARLFNVAFRAAERFPDVTQFGAGATIADAAVGAAVDASWWRERGQADALAGGDISMYAAVVDFARLHDGVSDESAVPRTGPMNRIHASRHSSGQGVDFSKLCGGLTEFADTAPCEGAFVGQLQPYALYVPAKPPPPGGWGLTLLLHSLAANYNQYSASRNQSQLGDRGAGTLVATPLGRGPDGSYRDVPEADVFEVWSDLSRHYPLDSDWTVVSGYSMGGFGTFRLMARWPDLFARGFSVVGAGSPNSSLASLRNNPVMTWAAAADELVNVQTTEETTRALTELGLRFVHDLFLVADHLTLATSDEYGPGAEFLGSHRVNRDPARVTYVVDPRTDSARAGTVADHAYWLSGAKLRDAGAGNGTIDVRSEGFGTGDAPVGAVAASVGAVEGGSRGPMPYLRREQGWGDAPAAPEADRLVVTASNVATATVDARRARVSCAPSITLVSDGPLDLRVACPAAVRTAGCTRMLRIRLPRVKGPSARRVKRVEVRFAGRVLARRKGRNLRTVRIRRPTRGAFSLRLRLRTSKGRTITVVRRYKACR